jgi:hypothetical protein
VVEVPAGEFQQLTLPKAEEQGGKVSVIRKIILMQLVLLAMEVQQALAVLPVGTVQLMEMEEAAAGRLL